jgi:hypothetical protein
MGVALSTYHAALVRGREEARSELVAEAVDAHLELVEGHRRQIGRLEEDAAKARGGGDLRAAAACEKAAQTAREGVKFGIDVTVCRKQADVQPGVNVTNFEMLQHFDADAFGALVGTGGGGGLTGGEITGPLTVQRAVLDDAT